MTNGSSQGLFVVVSVVIFGIFVSISYLLFRDQLTPSLASIFSDSILNTNKNIKNTLVTTADLETTNDNVAHIIRQTKDELIYYHDGSNYVENIKLDTRYVEPEKTYFFEYDIELIDGVVETFGGHASSFYGVENGDTVKNFYIDNVLMGNSYSGVKFSLKKGEKHTIKIFLDTRSVSLETILKNSGVYIQPNRHYASIIDKTEKKELYSPQYTVKITNLQLYEI